MGIFVEVAIWALGLCVFLFTAVMLTKFAQIYNSYYP